MSSASRHRRPRRRPWLVSLTAGVAVGLLAGGVSVVAGIGTPTSVARADTSSAVTVAANQQDTDLQNAPFPDLEVTVSQTRDLQAQGVEVSWTGGKKSQPPTGQDGGSDFLQIMQCWGDDGNNGPDRTKCQYGGFATPGATRDSFLSTAEVAPEDAVYTVPGSSFANPTYTGIPFFGANGDKVEKVAYNKNSKTTSLIDKDYPNEAKINLNSNQFFTGLTTNEVNWAGSGANGEGSVKFEVQTAAQSPGLGCGTPTLVTGGAYVGSSCWLVVVPRGSADVNETNIKNSGLLWDSWKHRIAVKLDFLPVGVRCTIGSKERQLSGSELASEAIASWQPSLCGTKGGAAYTTITGAESDATVAANGTSVAPMALTSRALSAPDVKDSLTYAPIALTGVSIAFAIDSEITALGSVPDDVAGKARLPFESMKLTPRLIAKLLTYSYLDSLPTGADKSHLGYKSPDSPGKNARNLTTDPEFLKINDPAWAYQSISAASVADLLVPQGRSDTARALWTYVLSDQDAVDFLMGNDDGNGMFVNPWSSMNPDVYASVAGTTTGVLTYPRDDFPKADPTEQPAKSTGDAAVNLVTWRPYTNDLATSANLVLRGDGQILGPWDPNSMPQKYTKTSRSLAGFQRVIGLTDTAAAAKYQVVSASLRNPAGEFVTPDTQSLSAAAAAMTADPAQAQVYRFDPTSDQAKGAPSAYPLTLPVYAAVNPSMSDAAVRADYANFINYAATAGQEPGTALGMLPEGYAPIPAGWQEQALAAAARIAAGPAKPSAAPTPKPTAPAAATAPVAPAAAPAAAPAPAPAPAADPAATGTVATALVGKPTPADKQLGALSAAVPIALLAGLLAAFAVPVLTRIRRRL
ncbi:hypothetical protein [Herbiconiux liangxiaofengii]|uniref:hypothetical protein n=1 Tax=Herbiconiux liangxiaofengii TaxID=3342795 RepID=UPI0035B73404